MKYNIIFVILLALFLVDKYASVDKEQFRLKAKEMFMHSFNNYMTHAYPADELMPLSCKGRYRDLSNSRGDIDDILGNYSLTLIDSLDTLYLMNELKLFEKSVRLVIDNVKFDANLTVSVFEVNIRIVGGLLGAHVAAVNLKKKGVIPNPNNQSEMVHFMKWYNDELLFMADDVGRRLLPAFNTPTGIPYPRINLKFGHTSTDNGDDISTCTACAGTMILEFAALSRLTGDPIFEEKATNTMNYLWEQRNRFSNLVGTTINIHNGNWLRRDSGLGAGIDSYYEYLLKAYVLLGNDTYLHRFTVHYDAIQRYISANGELPNQNAPFTSSLPVLPVDVNMHQPFQRVKNFMDSLLAFWPGLQVLFGDVKQAVAIHEILYQVLQRHNFLPEAFTMDFHVYWAHHLLRPEFLESNYFLYHSTGDPYYLDVGVKVLNNLEAHTRVKCGFAAIKDLRTMSLSDQMDSFVLAETFKYLYLLFTEPNQLPINMDDYIFTTEGHLLPLSLANLQLVNPKDEASTPDNQEEVDRGRVDESVSYRSCENHNVNADSDSIISTIFLNNQQTSPISSNQNSRQLNKSNLIHKSSHYQSSNDNVAFYKSSFKNLAATIRESLRDFVIRGGDMTSSYYGSQSESRKTVGISNLPASIHMPLLPKNLIPGDVEHVKLLKKMGINILTLDDGRMQLYHQPNLAASEAWSTIGEAFMHEMVKITQKQESSHNFLFISVLTSQPSDNKSSNKEQRLTISNSYKAAPAQFGTPIKSYRGQKYDLNENRSFRLGFHGYAIVAEPLDACKLSETIGQNWHDKIVVAERGNCMFIEKARNVEKAGGKGIVIMDNVANSKFDKNILFSMSGDGDDNVSIPAVFIFNTEGKELLDLIKLSGRDNVTLLFANESFTEETIEKYFENIQTEQNEMTFKRKNVMKLNKDISKIPHSRIDLHYRKVQPATKPQHPIDKSSGNQAKMPEAIGLLKRVEILKRKSNDEQDFPELEQFILRIYPNNDLSDQYKNYDKNPNDFRNSLMNYIILYTNIDELPNSQDFFTIIDWAINFNFANELTIQLTPMTSDPIKTLEKISDQLISKLCMDNSEDVYLPLGSSHTMSFDIVIYLSKDVTKNSNNKLSHDDSKNTSHKTNDGNNNSDIEHSEL